MAEPMIAIRDCFTYNKRFKKGDQFPYDWVKGGFTPNQHFMPKSQAEIFLRESEANKPINCAGDDPRSTNELKDALLKFTNLNAKWSRKEIWMKLREYENADAKTEKPKVKNG